MVYVVKLVLGMAGLLAGARFGNMIAHHPKPTDAQSKEMDWYGLGALILTLFAIYL